MGKCKEGHTSRSLFQELFDLNAPLSEKKLDLTFLSLSIFVESSFMLMFGGGGMMIGAVSANTTFKSGLLQT